MMNKVFATNGTGMCLIMTASGDHFTYEALRERRGNRSVKTKTPKRMHEVSVIKPEYSRCEGCKYEVITQSA